MDKIIADNDKNLPDGKKKRVLYHIGHYGFLSKMLLHKMAYHKNDDIIFVLNLSACSEKTREFASGWNKRNSDIGKMYGYFERAFMHGPNVHSLENEIVSSFDGFFKKNQMSIENFDKIYSGVDTTNAFGVYLSIKDMKYTLFDLAGTSVQKDSFYDLSRCPERELAYWGTMKKYRALSADSESVSSIIWDASRKYIGKEGCVLNYVQMQKDLNEQERNRLGSVFFDNDKEISGSGVLIVMRSGGAVTISKVKKYEHILSWPQRTIYPYRLLIDHCCSDEKIMLKSHPGSDYSDIVKETVPEIVSLPGYFPFELLNFEELKISRIFNTGSTSTRFINTDIDLVEVPQAAYFDHYPEMNALSISLHLSKYLYGELPNVFCGLQHWSEALAPLLACFAEGIYLVKSEDVDHLVNMRIIGDDQIERDSVIEKHEKFDRKSCTVVINPSVASAKLFSDNAVIIKIKKIECTSNAINYVGDLDSEYIMLISNNEKIIDATKKYTAKKHMKRCGIELDCSSMSIKDFIIEKQNLSGSIVFRTARMGNEEALKCIQNWLKKTYASVTPGENELFDHILDTFYDIISTLAYSDAGIAMGFFGSMYRDGRGVKRDLDKAAEWMRKAADKNVGWAKNELFVIIEESQAAEK